MKGRVLIVAGSDSGGGAGIQADLKTVTALGAYGATAITAVTDQDTQAVRGVHPVPPDFIAAQIKTVLSDIGADVIKTGMLPTAETVRNVGDALSYFGSDVPRVVDPVMVAKGGHKLIDDDAIETLKEVMIKGASVVTPNLPEAEVLTGLAIRTVADMEAAVVNLRTLGADAVVLKGGHVASDDVVDLLITKNNVERFTGPRLKSTSTHGTGCTLASAIAAGLAQSLDISAAVARARSYVFNAIKTAPGLGQGHGPLNHAHTVSNTLE